MKKKKKIKKRHAKKKKKKYMQYSRQNIQFGERDGHEVG